MATTKRNYGNSRTLGDIIYNPNTNSVFSNIQLGFFSKTITLSKREDRCYDILVSKYNSEETIKIGQTFPVKKQDNSIVEGLTQCTLGLLTTYDKDKQKTITNSDDALFITTHKLKKATPIGSKGFLKVGYITGKFGIEVINTASSNTQVPSEPEETPNYDDDGDQIPF